MTREEKELLFKDICARLPYGLVINIGDGDLKLDRHHQGIGILYPEDCSDEFNERHNNSAFYITISGCYYGEDIKPYLRPLSNMTEEEKDYIKNVARFKQSDGIHYDDGVHYVPIYQKTLDDQWKTDGKFPPILDDIYRFMLEYGYILLIDFFNSHYLDYRGLIPRGLAYEAPDGMYKIK